MLSLRYVAGADTDGISFAIFSSTIKWLSELVDRMYLENSSIIFLS